MHICLRAVYQIEPTLYFPIIKKFNVTGRLVTLKARIQIFSLCQNISSFCLLSYELILKLCMVLSMQLSWDFCVSYQNVSLEWFLFELFSAAPENFLVWFFSKDRSLGQRLVRIYTKKTLPMILLPLLQSHGLQGVGET